MTIKLYNFEQGSPEWHAARCGVLTASNVKLIISPVQLKPASNDKQRGHINDLAAQRVTQFVEPTFQGFDMLRGKEEEILARDLYSKNYASVDQIGFITNDRWGFTIGCSPDGLVGTDGGIQCKSHNNKYQMEVIVADVIDPEYMIQIQTELLVTERQWWDFVSYSNGMPMRTWRVYPDKKIQEAIVIAASLFNAALMNVVKVYGERLADPNFKLIPTERRAIVTDEIKPSED